MLSGHAITTSSLISRRTVQSFRTPHDGGLYNVPTCKFNDLYNLSNIVACYFGDCLGQSLMESNTIGSVLVVEDDNHEHNRLCNATGHLERERRTHASDLYTSRRDLSNNSDLHFDLNHASAFSTCVAHLSGGHFPPQLLVAVFQFLNLLLKLDDLEQTLFLALRFLLCFFLHRLQSKLCIVRKSNDSTQFCKRVDKSLHMDKKIYYGCVHSSGKGRRATTAVLNLDAQRFENHV